MKEKLISALVDLLKVKSIITLLSFVAFFYLSISGRISIDNFMLILGMIATYFFNKKDSATNDTGNESTTESTNTGKEV